MRNASVFPPIITWLAAFLIVASLTFPTTTVAAPPTRAALPLTDVVVILDPGHGDEPVKTTHTHADPGSWAKTPHGLIAWECVFTWDVSMRLKEFLEGKGAQVFLTLRDPKGDYRFRNWGPTKFPTVSGDGAAHKGQEIFRYKHLVDDPDPLSDIAALRSRSTTANRIYRKYSKTKDVYFLSIHFDSTAAPVDQAGMHFYHAPGGGTGFRSALMRQLRLENRFRRFLVSGEEVGVCQAANFSVLTNSVNLDSYLIELGFITSRHPKTGKNPDLWRMRSPQVREEYACLITRALVHHVQSKGDGP